LGIGFLVGEASGVRAMGDFDVAGILDFGDKRFCKVGVYLDFGVWEGVGI
jgi:hypothetical protein